MTSAYCMRPQSCFFSSLWVSKCRIASCGWGIGLSVLLAYQIPYFAYSSSQHPALAAVWQTYLSTEQLSRKRSISFIYAISELEPFKLGRGHTPRTACSPIRSTWYYYHYTLIARSVPIPPGIVQTYSKRQLLSQSIYIWLPYSFYCIPSFATENMTST